MLELTAFGKAVLALSAVYHLGMGGLCMVSVNVTRRLGDKLYALKLPDRLDPRYEYTWKPLGAYGVFTGAVAAYAYASADPAVQVFVLRALAGLYLVRAAQRVVYRELFTRAYDVPFARSLVNVVFNCGLAALMLILGLRTV